MKTYHGECHCGAVRFSFRSSEIRETERCDCSICARKGSILTVETIAPEDIDIDADDGALATYRFGTRVARHHFCKTCGIHTFVETKFAPGHYRVNLGCVDELDAVRLPFVVFDGKSL